MSGPNGYEAIWEEFYTEAVEELGMPEKLASDYADDMAMDRLTQMADDLMDRMKEGDL